MTVPAEVRAHHPSRLDTSIAAAQRITSQLTLEGADFDVAGRRGSWSQLVLEVQYAPVPWVSVGVNLPGVWMREEGRENTTGMGDMELGAAFRLLGGDGARFDLIVASQLELPTGSPDDGLGGGHFALIPRVEARWRPTQAITVVGQLVYSAALEAHAHSARISHSVLAIHALHELTLAARIGLQEGAAQVSVGLSTTHGLAEPQGPGPTTAQVAGAVALSGSWALTGHFEIPFAGQRRYEWRAGVGLRWTLDLNPAPEAGCGCGAPLACGCTPDACTCSD